MEALDAENEELLGIFFEEAQNLVDTLEENIMSLEDDPNNSDTIDEIFRAAHTLKGGSASVEMMELSEFTHIVEDVFDSIRDGKIAVKNDLVELLLNSLDVIKEMLEARTNGSVYSKDISGLKSKLKSFLAKEVSAVSSNINDVNHKDLVKSSFSEAELEDMQEGLGISQKVVKVSVDFNPENPMSTISGIQIFQSLKDVGPIINTIPEYEKLLGDDFISKVDYYLILQDLETVSIEKKLSLSDVVLNYDISEFNVSNALESVRNVTKNKTKLETVNTNIKLSDEEIFRIKNEVKDKTLFEVSVDFNPENPMSTISGLQILQALKSIGNIVKSVPDSNELLKDKFFSSVVYYLVSSSNAENISRKINLSDVVLDFKINNITLDIAESKVSPEINNTSENIILIDDDSEKSKNAKKSTPLNVNLIRIDSKKIDYILNLVSEAVISKSSYNQINTDMMSLFYNFNYFYDMQESFQKNFVNDLQSILKKLNLELDPEVEPHIKGLINTKMERILSDFNVLRNSFMKVMQNSKLTSSRFSRIVSDLHDSVLKTRMLPISSIFSKFPRVIRDLSKKLNKSVELLMEGEDTELDKSVIDDLLDPLMHCIRNSMDHGLEKSEDRIKKGKDSTGHITLRAKNEGNIISIEIEDDGNGINPEIIRKKSIEKGVINANSKLSDHDVINLIFAPGFSTASEITDVSGRGVGLDVVKKNIEKLNGNIIIESEVNVGTVFKIKLPLTLVIVQGLLIQSGVETYVVPLSNVLETHRINENDINTLENGQEVYNLREEVISVLRLNELFNIEENKVSKERFLIVISTNDKKAGIIVDSIIGEEDVVVKPIKDRFTSSPGIVGATTLGNGKVVLIIDVFKIFDLKSKRTDVHGH